MKLVPSHTCNQPLTNSNQHGKDRTGSGAGSATGSGTGTETGHRTGTGTKTGHGTGTVNIYMFI